MDLTGWGKFFKASGFTWLGGDVFLASKNGSKARRGYTFPTLSQLQFHGMRNEISLFIL